MEATRRKGCGPVLTGVPAFTLSQSGEGRKPQTGNDHTDQDREVRMLS